MCLSEKRTEARRARYTVPILYRVQYWNTAASHDRYRSIWDSYTNGTHGLTPTHADSCNKQLLCVSEQLRPTRAELRPSSGRPPEIRPRSGREQAELRPSSRGDQGEAAKAGVSLALCFCSFSRSCSGLGPGSGLVLESGSGLGLGLGFGLRVNPLLLPLLCTQARCGGYCSE